MKRWMIALLAAITFTAGIVHAEEETADLEKRLDDAQRRLEDAAREVAELSGQLAEPAIARNLEFVHRRPSRAMLGVNLEDEGVPGGGVRVAGVSPGGPAAEAGVEPGDVIVAIQSKPVATGRDVVRAMESIKPREMVDLDVRRDGKPVNLVVEARPLDVFGFIGVPGSRGLPPLAGVAQLAPLAMALEGDSHWLLEDWGDAEFVTLSAGLGRYFGTDRGVLVARAPAGDSLGLKDGDVIVAIGGREPQSGRHAMRILRSYQAGESVELKVFRDRKIQTLTARIPGRGMHEAGSGSMAPPAPRMPPGPVGAARLD